MEYTAGLFQCSVGRPSGIVPQIWVLATGEKCFCIFFFKRAEKQAFCIERYGMNTFCFGVWSSFSFRSNFSFSSDCCFCFSFPFSFSSSCYFLIYTFNPISIRIEHNTFKVSVSRSTRFTGDGISFRTHLFGET